MTGGEFTYFCVKAGVRAMPLIPCPECGRKISTAAEACPQCGHPNRPAPRTDPEPEGTGPTCYACSATATTRCQGCGALSCVLHVNSIYVQHGQGGANELRCEKCYSSAMAWKVVGFIIIGVAAIIMFAMFVNRGR